MKAVRNTPVGGKEEREAARRKKDKARAVELKKKLDEAKAVPRAQDADKPSGVDFNDTSKLNTRAKKAGKTDTVAVQRTVSKCGVTGTKTTGSTQAASDCVSPGKRLSNVGSSRAFEKAKTLRKKADRQENRLEKKVDRAEKKVKRNPRPSKRLANPRFL